MAGVAVESLVPAVDASCVAPLPLAGNIAFFGSACVPMCFGMYVPAAINTPTVNKTPIASHTPRLELGRAIGGAGTAPAAALAGTPGEVIGMVAGAGVPTLAGVGVGTGAGVRGAGVGAMRGVCGVSTSVVAPEGFGVGVTAVVFDAGSWLTSTLLNAARNASAL